MREYIDQRPVWRREHDPRRHVERRNPWRGIGRLEALDWNEQAVADALLAVTTDAGYPSGSADSAVL